jgi:hypothetical protein
MISRLPVGGFGDRRKGEGMSVSVVIPALNEAESLGWVLTQILKSQLAVDVIVVDGGRPIRLCR